MESRLFMGIERSPERAQIRVMEADRPMIFAGEVEDSARDVMVNVPAVDAVVLPGHAG